MTRTRLLLASALTLCVSGPALAFRQVSTVDGDTLGLVGSGLLTGFPLRVLGIDAPELRGKCPEEVALAYKAKARMTALAADGVTFLTDLKTDEYGRILVRVLDKQGRDLAAVLISEGLGRAYDGQGARKPWCPGATP